MRIDSIHLRNFKCFEDREFALAPRFNLVIGDNATGKTTILDGLAVALGTLLLDFPRPARSRSIFHDEVRLRFFSHGDTLTSERQFPVTVSCQGEVASQRVNWSRELTTTDGKTTRQNAEALRTIGTDLHSRVAKGDSGDLPVVSYYGTGRLWVQKRQRDIQALKPDSRFMGYLDCLEPASDEKRLLQWFKTQEIAAIQQGQPIGALEACRRAIMACVPEAEKVYFDVKRDQLMLELPQQPFPFSYLSDGFRNMVAMAADIAVRCATLNPQLRETAAAETRGVVLIDEIDLHLHPKWQRRVIGDLLNAFPRIQFVGTTHSPFVIQSLPPADTVRLINLDDPEADDFANKSVEDISEQVQGVELPQRSQRYVEMLKTAEEYYRLLREAPNASEEEKQRLSERLDELSLPFSDDPAYQALLQFERVAAGLNGEPS
ncbi:MAG TPA: AAA family ATPase [Pirellulales bacterium]|nr:AAA family ATPase [Pirellulales bacterium]